MRKGNEVVFRKGVIFDKGWEVLNIFKKSLHFFVVVIVVKGFHVCWHLILLDRTCLIKFPSWWCWTTPAGRPTCPGWPRLTTSPPSLATPSSTNPTAPPPGTALARSRSTARSARLHSTVSSRTRSTLSRSGELAENISFKQKSNTFRCVKNINIQCME